MRTSPLTVRTRSSTGASPASAGGMSADVEVGVHRAAHRLRVDPEREARPGGDVDVARDRADAHRGAGGLEVDVARHGVQRRVFVRAADPDVARDGADRGRAADRADVDVTGRALRGEHARDGAGREIAARGVEKELPDIADGHVAGGGLHRDVPQWAAPLEVRAVGRHVDVGALRAANRDPDLGAAAEDAEPALALGHLDEDLVQRAPLLGLDPRLGGGLAGALVTTKRR